MKYDSYHLIDSCGTDLADVRRVQGQNCGRSKSTFVVPSPRLRTAVLPSWVPAGLRYVFRLVHPYQFEAVEQVLSGVTRLRRTQYSVLPDLFDCKRVYHNIAFSEL